MLSVHIPEGVPQAVAADRIERLLHSLALDYSDAAVRRRALESDEGLREFLRKMRLENAPIVRASVYAKHPGDRIGRVRNGRSIWHGQELFPWDEQTDPRRPVAMRGALRVLIAAYAAGPSASCANGWCEEVVRRYLRRIRYRCFNGDEHREFMGRVRQNLAKKHQLSYHFNCCEMFFGDGQSAYIGGRLRALTPDQFEHLRRLDEIIRKTETLEQRRAALSRKRAAAPVLLAAE